MKINKFGIFLVFLMSFMILSGNVFATNQSQIPVVYKITGDIDLPTGQQTSDSYRVVVTTSVSAQEFTSPCYTNYTNLENQLKGTGFFIGPLSEEDTGNSDSFNLNLKLNAYTGTCASLQAERASVVIAVPNPNVGSKNLIADTVVDGGIDIDQLRASSPGADKVLAIDNSGDELTWIDKSDVAPSYTAGDAITITGNVIDVKESGTHDHLRGIGSDHIKSNAVTSGKIRSSSSNDALRSIGTNHIRNDAITTLKIDDRAVTIDKLFTGTNHLNPEEDVLTWYSAPGDVPTLKWMKISDLVSGGETYTAGDAIDISPGNVISVEDYGISNDKLGRSEWITDPGCAPGDKCILIDVGNPAVDTDNIINLSITSNKIASGAITQGKIANNAVTSLKIADNAVNRNKIQNFAVNNSKIADNSINVRTLDVYGIPSGKCPVDGAVLIYHGASGKLMFQEGYADCDGLKELSIIRPYLHHQQINSNITLEPKVELLGATDLTEDCTWLILKPDGYRPAVTQTAESCKAGDTELSPSGNQDRFGLYKVDLRTKITDVDEFVYATPVNFYIHPTMEFLIPFEQVNEWSDIDFKVTHNVTNLAQQGVTSCYAIFTIAPLHGAPYTVDWISTNVNQCASGTLIENIANPEGYPGAGGTVFAEFCLVSDHTGGNSGTGGPWCTHQAVSITQTW